MDWVAGVDQLLMVVAVAVVMRVRVGVLMAVSVAMRVAEVVIVLMTVLVAVTGVVLMVVAMNIEVRAVNVAGKVTLLPIAVVPQIIKMLRASAIPAPGGLLLLIGLHATTVQGSGCTPQQARQVLPLPVSAPCSVSIKPGLHRKPGNGAFSQRHLLSGISWGKGTAKGTVWSPAAAGTLMLHSRPSLSFCMGGPVSTFGLPVAMFVQKISASDASTEQVGQWPLSCPASQQLCMDTRSLPKA